MDIAVIGGGASGIMAAITAARNGGTVTILEHTDRIGKKILVTGNGKCNITNSNQDSSFYRSSQPDFPFSVIQQFHVQNTIQFFNEIGLYSKNKNGYLYPHAEQASAVLEVLRMELKRLQVTVLGNIFIHHIKKAENKFTVTTNEHTFQFDKIILATGSKAAPKTGSDGSGYSYAQKFGHTLVKPLPALVQLRSDFSFLKHLAGVRCDGLVSLKVEDRIVAAERGEIQWVNYGISGIPVFQLSRFAAIACDKKESCKAVIDLMPDFTEELCCRMLTKRKRLGGHKIAEEFFIGLFHKKIGIMLLKLTGIPFALPVSRISDRQLQKLTGLCKKMEITITGTNSYDNAQTCTGGIKTSEINSEMQSKIVPGLYFAGEITDVDGCCGGYNLQWAWSSGYVAGLHAAKG